MSRWAESIEHRHAAPHCFTVTVHSSCSRIFRSIFCCRSEIGGNEASAPQNALFVRTRESVENERVTERS